MDYSKLLQNLQQKFEKQILSTDDSADIFTVVVEAAAIKSIISWLKSEQEFIFLTDICGIQFPEQELEFGVIYHLHNLVANARLRLKVFVTRENPVVPSIVDVFSGANWMERETFDFYGIQFEGHPNLTRILNVEYMDYHPMRKEYPLEDATRDDKDDRYFGR